MSFLISAVRLLCKPAEVDKTFTVELHRAAEQGIGLCRGRQYLVISNGKLGLTHKKSEETPFEELTTFVNRRLKGLTEQEVKTAKEDLLEIGKRNTHEKQVNPGKIHPRLIGEAVGFLTLNDYTKAKRVCKNWNWDEESDLAKRVRCTIYAGMAFKLHDYKTYYGVDAEISKENLEAVNKQFKERLLQLDERCSFWPNGFDNNRPNTRKIKTHIRPFILPETVNGKPFTAKEFREMIKNPTDKSRKSDYDFIWDQILKDHGDTPNKIPRWEMMARDVVPDSLNQSYAVQINMVEQNPGYEVVGLLPGLVGPELEYVKTGNRLFSEVYFRTSAKSEGYPIAIRFLPAGLRVCYYDYVFPDVGVVAARKS